jgi:hypothetical protein
VALLPVITTAWYFLTRDAARVTVSFIGLSTNQNSVRFSINNPQSQPRGYMAMAQEQRNGQWVRRVIRKPDVQGMVPARSTETFEMPVFSTNHWRATVTCAESIADSPIGKFRLKLFSIAYQHGWTNLSRRLVIHEIYPPALKIEFDGNKPSQH